MMFCASSVNWLFSLRTVSRTDRSQEHCYIRVSEPQLIIEGFGQSREELVKLALSQRASLEQHTSVSLDSRSFRGTPISSNIECS